MVTLCEVYDALGMTAPFVSLRPMELPSGA